MNKRLTEEKRRELAGRARTLHERLDGPSNKPEGVPPIDPDQIINEWKERFPNDESFYNRLKKEELTEATIRQHIEATHWPPDEPLPNWIDDIEKLIRHIESVPPNDQHITNNHEETPFAELITVIADYAYGCLPEETVSIDTLSPMIEWFVTQLKRVSIRPLYVEFKSFIEYHDPEVAQADPEAFANPPTKYYDQFIDALFDGGFTNLCVEYPVLSRQFIQLIDHWVGAVTEVCQRLQADRSVICKQFGVDGDVVALNPLSDDTHAGGRVPIRISFESGDVIYKPREVDSGIAFYTILSRLDEHLSTPSFKIPEYISRDDYGWMEPIEYCNPIDKSGVDRYYERAGAILCVAYALNFVDCQRENIIVNGDNPMIIDTEAIFHPHIDSSSGPMMTELMAMVNRSVLLTLLLPWSTGDPRKLDDEKLSVSGFLAGLGSESGQTQLSHRSRPAVEAVNTDVMSIGVKKPTIDRTTNTPSINNTDQPPEEHVDAIVSGFERTHKKIRNLHANEQFLSDVITPELIDGIKNRLVYRPTSRYQSILLSAAARDPLRDGVRLSVEMEELAVPFFDGQINTDRYWPLYEAERKSLFRLDVPRFTSHPNQTSLFHDGIAVNVHSDKSGYEQSRQRLDTMDTTDQHRQAWLIRQSFGSTTSPTTAPPMTDGSNNLTDNQLCEEAIKLFDGAIDAAMNTSDGNVWVSISPTDTTFTMVPAGLSLFYGRGGLALTAAALHHATGPDRYQKFVSEIFSPVIDDIIEGRLSFGLGGTLGAGSVVYVLSAIAELFDENVYRRGAMEVAKGVTEEQLTADDTFDVMEGTAGTLLGLLAYHDRYGGSTILDRAIACGERLLEARVTVDGHRVWKTIDNVPITGFAHGTSGIAYALARLAATTEKNRYAEAAREALSFESTLYAPAKNNWDSSWGMNKYQDRWCHGRSGILLARMGIAEYLDDETLLTDVNTALSATASAPPSPVDHVCCGNFGRVETLLTGARRINDSPTDATNLAGRCLARRKSEGTFSFPGHTHSFVNPTFFKGVSGAAYTLLRLRNPDKYPSVLRLE